MPHQCTSCERVFADGSKEMLSGCPDCGGNTFQYLPDGADPTPASASPDPPERPGPESKVAETVGRAATTLRDAVSRGTDALPGEESGPPPADGTDAELVDDSAPSPDEPAVDDPDSPEGLAQSSARTDVVEADELPDGMVGLGRGAGEGERQQSPSEPTSGSGPAGHASPAGPTSDPSGVSSSDPSRASSSDPSGASSSDPPAERGRVVDEPSGERPDLSELREELNDQFEGIRIVERGQYELNLMELYEREETIIALKENGRYVIEPPESWRGET